MRAHLVDRFARGDAARAHGGRIEVDSTGSGAAFTVTLPAPRGPS